MKPFKGARRAARSLLVLATLLSTTAPPSAAQTSRTAGPARSRPDARGAKSAPGWWKHAVFYEIYPRSFQDSNGDGVGDLNGITSRLEYLARLGVDAVWITPFYPSPQVDFGYDVS